MRSEQSFTRLALIALTMTVATWAAGHWNVRLAAAQALTPQASSPKPQASLARQTLTQIPIGYDPQPASPALRVHRPQIGGEGFVIGITNRATATLTTLQYVAIVETVGWRVPVRVLTSDAWALTLAPGDRAELESGWLEDRELVRLSREATGPIQIYLSPAYARYADNAEWRAQINASAKNCLEALGLTLPGR